jgi:hypothetical protein
MCYVVMSLFLDEFRSRARLRLYLIGLLLLQGDLTEGHLYVLVKFPSNNVNIFLTHTDEEG